VLEKLAEIQMIDVWIPTVDQRWLILPRYTQPSSDTKLLIEKTEIGVAEPAATRASLRKKRVTKSRSRSPLAGAFVVKTF